MLPSPEPMPDPSAPPPSEPAAADTEFAAHCDQCGTNAKWKGPITDEMIERTFTRGLDEATGLPNCPHCGTPMVVPPAATATEAIEQAAAAEPSATEPRQARIPGLTPAFDFRGAFESIIEQRRIVRHAEAIAESKHKDAAKAKKTADEEQGKLSQLEDEYEERAEEIAAEANLTPAERRAKTCAFERATGTPCPICSVEPGGTLPTAIDKKNDGPSHMAIVAEQLAGRRDLRPDDLIEVLETVAGMYLDRGEVERWDPEQLHAVTIWLAAKTNGVSTMRPPKILGRQHVSEGPTNNCKACGALLNPLAAARGLDRWPDGALVGTDCDGGKPKRRGKKKSTSDHMAAGLRPTFAALQALLQQAGATIALEVIKNWNADECGEAQMWAYDQLAAWQKDKPGHRTSVRWPDHVSFAARAEAKSAITSRKRTARGNRKAGMTRRRGRR